MRTLQNTPPTFESVWATLQEVAQQQKENERILNEKFAETDRLFKENAQQFAQQQKENERILNEKFAETSRLFKENAQEQKELNAAAERRMKNMDERMGGWANNHGSFAEEYFFNSFEHGKQNFFGEKFDEIVKQVKGLKKGFKDEYDILLINGKSIGIVEVKFKAHVNDVPQILRKAETFRVNFSEYEKHQIYLGLATMVFYPELEQECIEQGIAVIKQVGDTVVIHDGHLKVF